MWSSWLWMSLASAAPVCDAFPADGVWEHRAVFREGKTAEEALSLARSAIRKEVSEALCANLIADDCADLHAMVRFTEPVVVNTPGRGVGACARAAILLGQERVSLRDRLHGLLPAGTGLTGPVKVEPPRWSSGAPTGAYGEGILYLVRQELRSAGVPVVEQGAATSLGIRLTAVPANGSVGVELLYDGQLVNTVELPADRLQIDLNDAFITPPTVSRRAGDLTIRWETDPDRSTACEGDHTWVWTEPYTHRVSHWFFSVAGDEVVFLQRSADRIPRQRVTWANNRFGRTEHLVAVAIPDSAALPASLTALVEPCRALAWNPRWTPEQAAVAVKAMEVHEAGTGWCQEADEQAVRAERLAFAALPACPAASGR
jgi:hypothetical protein